MMKRFAPWLVILLTPLLLSMGKKEEYAITFHCQGTDTDMQKTIFPMVLDGRSLLFKILPEFSQNNISAFHSFPADTGGYGVTLQLDFRGKGALEMLTRTRHGEYLLAMVNGKPVDYVVIDQIITNGMITIWQGVPETVVQAMDKQFPRIKTGEEAPSMTDKFDMAPTTKQEKKSFFKRFKREEKEKQEGKETEPEIPSFNLPTAPTTPAAPTAPTAPTSNQIPIEGAEAPLPQQSTPVVEPPLPQ